jgi:hypothetical protein
VEDRALEKSWQHERFLVNGKYLIIRKAVTSRHGDKQVLIMNILAREPLIREDLTALKRKIQTNFNKKLIIRVNMTYIP